MMLKSIKLSQKQWYHDKYIVWLLREPVNDIVALKNYGFMEVALRITMCYIKKCLYSSKNYQGSW